MTKSTDPQKSLVSLVKFDETEDSLEKTIQKALDLIQFKFDANTNNVVIKPNLCYYQDYSTGETTDPKFVSSLIDVIRNSASSGVKISIVESDASAMVCQHVFRMLGYEKMALDKSVELVNLSTHESNKTKVTVNHNSREFLVPQIIAEADLLIDVPKIKYMQGVKVSCALKNMFGCNPYREKFRYHKRLDETIVGLNKIMRSHLCVLDGLVVKGVKTAKLGLVMASTDPVAVDAAASEIAGVNPNSVKHIMLASKERIGNMNFDTRGADLDHFRSRFPRKTITYKIRGLLGNVYYRFSPIAYVLKPKVQTFTIVLSEPEF